MHFPAHIYIDAHLCSNGGGGSGTIADLKDMVEVTDSILEQGVLHDGMVLVELSIPWSVQCRPLRCSRRGI